MFILLVLKMAVQRNTCVYLIIIALCHPIQVLLNFLQKYFFVCFAYFEPLHLKKIVRLIENFSKQSCKKVCKAFWWIFSKIDLFGRRLRAFHPFQQKSIFVYQKYIVDEYFHFYLI